MSPHLLSGSAGTFLEQFSASVMFVFTANTPSEVPHVHVRAFPEQGCARAAS